ncbi:copper homeostasis protein CutC [Odoribacter lunatus]|uniref:copper homeostasis protein CutC n=1 Tax=Odoribacter lunatus TaxID=2941335 RepID=UPI002040897B|nr:copper homeostasis protein CutC [Odoribacter lunatus]
MKKCELEICAYSLESCRAAKEAGADRVELCAAMYDGGTTPSAATIRMARELTEGMELYVMIRPRGGDFLYSEWEYRQMWEDIRFVKESGADGVVLGILAADGIVDVERMTKLVAWASPLKVTFHRAFDMTRNAGEALEAVIGCGCHRILTSGMHNTATEGVGVLRELVRQAQGRIQIMAGSGVNVSNARQLLETGVDALHMSGKSVRDSAMVFRNPHIFMGGVPGIPEYDIAYSDKRKIEEVVKVLQTCR